MDNYIKELDLKIDALDKELSKYNTTSNINLNDVLNIDIDGLKKILPDTFSEDLICILVYKRNMTQDILSLGEYKDMKDKILLSIKDKLLKINNYLKEKTKEQDTKSKEKDTYQELRNLFTKENIDENDIELFYNKIKDIQELIGEEKAFNMLYEFGKKVFDNKVKQQTNEPISDDVIIINENENKEEIKKELINIFKKYDIDFNKFKNDNKENLITKCNTNNVSNILNIIEEYNIDIKSLFKKKEYQITQILIYSNTTIFKEVLDFSQKNNLTIIKNNHLNIDALLEYPARFIENKQRKFKKIHPTGEGGFEDITFTGCARNFMDNYTFLTNIGMEKDKYMKTITIQDVNTEHIKSVVSLLDMYGIPRESYLKTPSFLIKSDPSSIIDIHIELGLFDYIKNRTSVLLKDIDDMRFYYIAFAIKHTDININDYVKQNMLIDKLKQKLSQDEDIIPTMFPIYKSSNTNKYDDILNKNYNFKIDKALNLDIIKKLDNKYLNNNLNNNTYYLGSYDVTKNNSIEKTIPVMVSRLKVLRYLNTLIENNIEINEDSLMYVMCKNSLFNKEDQKLIKTSIKDLFKERVK